MDRTAAVIRTEMSQTRASLDRKLTLLESKAREYSPRQLSDRYVPDYLAERVIGGVLMLVGLRMAWGMYRKRRNHREHVRMMMATYGHW